MACLISSHPAVANSYTATRGASYRAAHVSKDAALASANAFFDPTPGNACKAMRAMSRASFASAVAAAHATCCAANAAIVAGEVAEKNAPDGFAKANQLAKTFGEAAEKNVPQGMAFANGLAETFAEVAEKNGVSKANDLAKSFGETAEKNVPQGVSKANGLAKSFGEAAATNVPAGLAMANGLARSFAAALGAATAKAESQLRSTPTENDWEMQLAMALSSGGDAAPMDPETFPRLLDQLDQMGFTDRELNERLLVKHEGNVQLAVRELVKKY